MCWRAKKQQRDSQWPQLRASWSAAAVWGRACVGFSRLDPLCPRREGVRDDMTYWKYCRVVITERSILFFSARFGLSSNEAAHNEAFICFCWSSLKAIKESFKMISLQTHIFFREFQASYLQQRLNVGLKCCRNVQFVSVYQVLVVM